jgi:hypothetical protein
MDLKVGDVILIGPSNPQWSGCLARVQQLMPWGVRAWVVGPAWPDFPRVAEFPLRVEFSNVAVIFREIEAQSHPQRGEDSA